MSGRLWEQQPIIGYCLHRWPSRRSMQGAQARVRALTGRPRAGGPLPGIIAELNLFPRGRGNYFRTGNAADRFVQMGRYEAWRLQRLLIKKRGQRNHVRKTAGKPYTVKPHVRTERGWGNRTA